MRIIKLLYERKEPLMTKEIWKRLNLSQPLARHNLKKLVKCKIVECVLTSPIDLRTRYFQITNYDLAKKLIKRFHYVISFKLAKLLPFSTVSLNDLKKNQKFLEVCNNYGLTIDEGIEALKLNHRKVECVYSDSYSYSSKKQLKGFKRKEQ